MRPWPLLLVAALSCSRPGSQTPRSTAPRVAQVDEVAAAARQLVLPPNDQSFEAYLALEEAADRGNDEALWQRVHYLLDLFDSARFGRSPEALALLAKIAGRPSEAMHGAAATQAVAELLLLEIDHLLEHRRDHAQAQAARVLLQYDLQPPTSRNQAYQRLLELRRIQHKQLVLENSASLRLFHYCQQALLDSFENRGRARREARAHCLYALYPANPEPYFHRDPSRRPPAPRLSRLLPQMRALLPVAPIGRLAPAIQAARQWVESIDITARTSPEDALAWMEGEPLLELAASTTAPALDDLVVLGAPSPQQDERTSALLQALQQNALALPLTSESKSRELLEGARRAATLGAQELHLVVRIEQRLRAPKGDYWAEELADEDEVLVARSGALPLSLAPMQAREARREGGEAMASSWDSARAELGLTLVLGTTSWELFSDRGRLASWPAETVLPTGPLTTIAEQLYRAYPELDAIVIVPSPELPIGTLVAALDLLRQRSSTGHRIRHIAIDDELPQGKPARGLLDAIERRARAQVSVSPESAESRRPIARRCYQEQLDRRALRGKVRLERNARGKLEMRPRKGLLSSCAERAYGGLVLEGDIDAVEVEFELAAPASVSTPGAATDESR